MKGGFPIQRNPRSFRSKQTALRFGGHRRRRFSGIARVAQRKPEQLNAASTLADLTAFPGNRLEALRGDRSEEHSIQVTIKFRICFVWRDRDAYDVEIVDYH
jgi:proteic killer suppression protein